MTLVLFDIDGTLTESFALDTSMSLDAVRVTFGFRDISEDWSSYRHVTGAGVLREIVETRLDRPPTQKEVGRVLAHITVSLQTGIKEVGGVRPTAGAEQLLARLIGSPNEYVVALASGNWATIARIVLDSAGLRVDGVLSAYSDDAPTREDICRTARRRAEERHGGSIPRVVYVGDGTWDVQAARALGYGFVGIGQSGTAAKLREAGATEVRPDFLDAEAFLAAVDRAAISQLASSQSAGTTASAR